MRVVTALFVCLLGGLGLLINLFGFAMNGPFEPPMGMTSEEHYRRLTPNSRPLDSSLSADKALNNSDSDGFEASPYDNSRLRREMSFIA